MRNFFLILVLANLGFAAWHSWFASGAWPSRAWSADGAGITLMSEVEPAGSVASAPSPGRSNAGLAKVPDSSARRDSSLAFVPPGPDTPSCVSIGPFGTAADLDGVRGTLADAGYTADRREARGEVWIGQWVYIDTIPTQAAANEIVAQLRSAGIPEAYVIADADSGNIVSLGVFTESARAELRLGEARALGYEPTVSDRTQPGPVYWLDIATTSADFPALADLLDGIETDRSIRRESCPQQGERQ